MEKLKVLDGGKAVKTELPEEIKLDFNNMEHRSLWIESISIFYMKRMIETFASAAMAMRDEDSRITALHISLLYGMAHDKCWHRFYKMFNADNKKTSWTFNHIEGVYTPMEKVDD